MQSTKGRLVKGAAWMTLARIVVNALGFISTIWLARLLMPADFGLVAIATAIGLITAAITDLSMAQALIQHEAPEEEHFHTAWTLNFGRAFLLAAMLAGAAYPAAALYADDRLINVILALAIAAFIGGLQNPKLVMLQRQLVFWQEFVLNVADKLAGFIVSILLAILLRSYWALVAGLIASQVVRTALSYGLYRYRPRFTLSRHRDLLSFSVWLTLSNAIQQMSWRSDPLLVGALLPASQVGIYSLSDRLASLPIRESLGPVTSALFPAFSRIRGERHRLSAAYLRAQGIICTLAFAVGTLLAVLAEPVVLVLIGEKWLPTVPIIQVLSVLIAASTIQNVQPLAMSVGRTKTLLGIDLRAFAVRFPLVLGGLILGNATPLGPLMGLVAGRCVANLSNTAWNMLLVRDVTGLSLMRQLAVGVRPILAAALMALCLYLVMPHLGEATSQVGGLVRLGLLATVGLAIYSAAIGLMAWIAPRPEGPEREIIQVVTTLGRRIRAGRLRKPDPSQG
jgi:O-antigen/teichoic acid export membrane protein